MDNINEGIRNVVFEGKVLSWYENRDPNKKIQVSILALQCD
jgi:hypothetical protein